MATLLDLDPQRRDALLNAALKEFTTQGYDSASTNIIAKEAGLSKALMFHYVGSKQELFWGIYDYFNELLNREYYSKMDYSIKDIFERLRTSYLLQISLMKQYPRIFDFEKLSAKTKSVEINAALAERERTKKTYEIFSHIDTSKFRPDLDIEKCKQFILWANIGFTNQILEDIRKNKGQIPNFDCIIGVLDDYLNELKKIFFVSDL